VIVVSVPGLPPTPNSLRRANWHQRADQTRYWRDLAHWAALEVMELHPGTYPIHSAAVRVVIVAPTKARRDPDNALASIKGHLDGIVGAGLLADDSFAVIRSLTVALERGEPGVRIEIEEALG
jgi:hypothetical protein